ncbi:MAG: helix-turn-helix transcriptional regulator [Oscillibacter sp.]|nr:helix-turn-helix transcriptional regulator [Oscillibacter sp.]
MSISSKIDDIITDGNIKIKDLSEKLGVIRQQIARWRRGSSEPTAHNIKGLCEIYNISADYILECPKGLAWPREE